MTGIAGVRAVNMRICTGLFARCNNTVMASVTGAKNLVMINRNRRRPLPGGMTQPADIRRGDMGIVFWRGNLSIVASNADTIIAAIGAGDFLMIHGQHRRPGSGSNGVAGIAYVAGIDMIRSFAYGLYAIVATAAGTQDKSMIHLIRLHRPTGKRRHMAGATVAGGGNMTHGLAKHQRAIMTGVTVSHDFRVIHEVCRIESGGIVTGPAIVRGRHVMRRITSYQNIVMTTGTLTKSLGMIHGDHRPQSRGMTSSAQITGVEVVRCFSRGYRVIMTIQAFTNNLGMIHGGSRYPLECSVAGLTQITGRYVQAGLAGSCRTAVAGMTGDTGTIDLRMIHAPGRHPGCRNVAGIAHVAGINMTGGLAGSRRTAGAGMAIETLPFHVLVIHPGYGYPGIGDMTGITSIRTSNMSDIFSRCQLPVVAIGAFSIDFVVIHLDLLSPARDHMTCFTDIRGRDMQRVLPCGGNTIVATNTVVHDALVNLIDRHPSPARGVVTCVTFRIGKNMIWPLASRIGTVMALTAGPENLVVIHIVRWNKTAGVMTSLAKIRGRHMLT